MNEFWLISKSGIQSLTVPNKQKLILIQLFYNDISSLIIPKLFYKL